MGRPKVTITDLYQQKAAGQKISVCTAYDYPTARLMDRARVDCVLVGDSLGNVMLGYESTVPVTMDEMLHHIKAVRRGLKRAYLIGDLPFMSYQASIEDAVRNAGRFMKEGGCDCVKLEGGAQMAPTVRALTNAGIGVCAHIGLTPQSVSQLGGYKVQGKDLAGGQQLIEDAKALGEAGAMMIVFECMPAPLAAAITRTTDMITIGIGAGPGCDGQVLVFHDLVGYGEKAPPKMVRQYVNLHPQMEKALTEYVAEVKSGAFPGDGHGFGMEDPVLQKLRF